MYTFFSLYVYKIIISMYQVILLWFMASPTTTHLDHANGKRFDIASLISIETLQKYIYILEAKQKGAQS